MFTHLIYREQTSPSWQKIPWHDPEFSRRMLAEHLSQGHDLASRRLTIIDQHVQWIHRKILHGRAATILDLGCGPGFYAGRLAELGHTCTGVDISPASIAHAREHHPGPTYILGDVREVDFGAGYDLVAMIYGELNAFSSQEAQQIVERAHAALRPGGHLLLEVHTYEAIYRIGQEPPTWRAAERGLFSDDPYLCLIESAFDVDHAISQYYVYAADGATIQQYTSMHRAYTDDEYRRLLAAFQRVLFYPTLTGSPDPADLFVIVAEK